ncbi:MAG: retroviral-like aspartic protease family protein [Candidatus Omnitrophica bacterium]|nr:retroviral-like aspartic protease family protein [Candidatus Omnitrophota bacterium]
MKVFTKIWYSQLIWIFFLACWAICILKGVAFSDTVYLSNGRTIEGIIVEEHQEQIILDIGFGRIGIKRKDISRIQQANEKENKLLREKWINKQIELKNKEQQQARLEQDRDRISLYPAGGNAYWTEVLLNNKVKARLILDTGASLTFISPEVAHKLGIDINSIKKTCEAVLADGSKTTVKLINLKSIQVGKIEAFDVPVAIMNLRGEENKDGLLGMSFLHNFKVNIDYEHQTMTLEKRK